MGRSVLVKLGLLCGLAFVQLSSAAAASPFLAQCQNSSGAATWRMQFAPPIQTRSFQSIIFGYDSDSDSWGFVRPYFIEDISGANKQFFDGNCFNDLNQLTGQSFTSAAGLRIKMLASGYSIITDEGGVFSFSKLALSGGKRLWYLTNSRVPGGWQTDYVYLNGSLIRVDIDSNPAANLNQKYSLNFTYPVGAQLGQVTLFHREQGAASGPGWTAQLASPLVQIARYDLQYSGSRLNDITVRDGNNLALGHGTFTYYASGQFAGLLKKATNILGGSRTYNYMITPVVDVVTGASSQKTSVRSITVNPVTGNSTTENYTYNSGENAGSIFLGYDQIEAAVAGVSKKVYEFYKSDARRGSIRSIEVRGDDGTLLKRDYFYIPLGVAFPDKAFIKNVVSQEFASGVAVTRGKSFNWNYSLNRLDSIQAHNQSTYDFISENFQSGLNSDDRILNFTYGSDLPAVSRYNLISNRTILDSSQLKLAETQYEYEVDGRPNLIREWDSSTNSYRTTDLTVDGRDNLIEVVHPSGLVDRFSWHAAQLKSIQADPSGLNFVTSFNYDPQNGLLYSTKSPNGLTEYYLRDGFFRITDYYVSNGLMSFLPIELTYDDANGMRGISRFGMESWLKTDGYGRVKKFSEEADSSGAMPARLINYGAYSDLANYTAPPFMSSAHGLVAGESSSNEINISHDWSQRHSEAVPALFGDGIGAYSVDRFVSGMLSAPVINPQGFAGTDSLGNLVEIGHYQDFSYLRVGSGSETGQYLFTQSPFMESGSDPLGNPFFTTYDSLNREQSNSSLKSADSTFEYNPAGLLKKITYASGGAREFLYDALGRITQKTDTAHGSQETTTFVWDNASLSQCSVMKGALGSIVGPNDHMDFCYDHLSRLSRLQHTLADGTTREFRFEYNFQGSLSAIHYPEEISGGPVAVYYQYDANGREFRVTTPNIENWAPSQILREIVSRSPIGKPTQLTWFNDVEEYFDYSSVSDKLLNYQLRRISNGALLDQRVLTYDQGNLISKTEGVGASAVTYNFDQYNSQNLLTQYSTQVGGGAPIVKQQSWDVAGRKLNDPDIGATLNYQAGSTHPYSPDSITIRGRTYPWSYNVDKQPTSISGPQSKDNATFTYGPSGDVIRVTRSPSEYVNFYRGVLGNLVRIETRLGGQITTTKVFGFGLYQEVSVGAGPTTATYSIYGEGYEAERERISALTFQGYAPLMSGGSGPGEASGMLAQLGGSGSSSLLLDGDTDTPEGGDTGIPPKRPLKPKKPVPPPAVCGNGVIEDTEMCDVIGCGTGFVCSAACVCVPKVSSGPNATTATTYTNGTSVDQGGGTVTKPEYPEDKTYVPPGTFPVTTTGPCDEIKIVTIHVETDENYFANYLDQTGRHEMAKAARERGEYLKRFGGTGDLFRPKSCMDCHGFDCGDFGKILRTEVYPGLAEAEESGLVLSSALTGGGLGLAGAPALATSASMLSASFTVDVMRNGPGAAGKNLAINSALELLTFGIGKGLNKCMRLRLEPRVRTAPPPYMREVARQMAERAEGQLCQLNEIYVYTDLETLDKILESGMIGRPGATEVFATGTGGLSPMQAQLGLSLNPARGPYNVRLTLDPSMVTDAKLLRCGPVRPESMVGPQGKFTNLFGLGGETEFVFDGPISTSAVTDIFIR